MDAITYAAALANLANTMDRVCNDHEALIITRNGQQSVVMLSLEDFTEMPVLRTTQGHEEFEEAQKEGIRFVTRRGPRRLLGNGRLRPLPRGSGGRGRPAEGGWPAGQQHPHRWCRPRRPGVRYGVGHAP